MATKETYWSVYLSQHGCKVQCNVTDATCRRIQTLLHKGRPFGLWFRMDSGRLTGLTVNPVFGGLVLSIEKPVRIPINAQGQPAQTEAEIARWIEPEDQAIGEVTLPEWSNMSAFDGEDPELELPPKPAETTHVNGKGGDAVPAPQVVETDEDEEPPGPIGGAAGSAGGD